MERLKNPFASSESANNPTNEISANSNDDFIAFSDTSTPAKSNNDHFHPKRGKSNRMGNWQRFAAFNQEHQSPIPSPQRRNWNHGNVSKQNFYHRGSPNNFRGNMSNPNQSSRGSTPNFSFAQHSQRGAPRSEPGMRGGGSYRGAPGFFGTPQENPARPFHRGGHSSNPNYTPRGSFRGNRSRGRPNNPFQYSSFNKNKESDCGNGYFHPEMLENPWQKLEAKSNPSLANTPSAEDINCAKMSDSMIPQLDDTVLQRHQDIQQNEDSDKTLSDSKCSQNLSDYGDSSDEDNVIITINKTPDKSDNVKSIPQPADSHESTKINDALNENEISKSDSMIPLVGDSILAQDVTIDT